jgi:hypothetical protein
MCRVMTVSLRETRRAGLQSACVAAGSQDRGSNSWLSISLSISLYLTISLSLSLSLLFCGSSVSSLGHLLVCLNATTVLVCFSFCFVLFNFVWKGCESQY